MFKLKLYIITPILLPYQPHSSRCYFCGTLYFLRKNSPVTNSDWGMEGRVWVGDCETQCWDARLVLKVVESSLAPFPGS